MKKTLLIVATALYAISGFAQQMTSDAIHSKYILACDEFQPAPGQFTNMLPKYVKGDNADSMVVKCTKAIANNNKGMISLGAYGGYVTFHFDHSIANIRGKRDLYVMGNAFQAAASTTAGGSSEPGIIMVSKDENHNGIADDKWYEIAGSCDRDSLDKMTFGYETTYYYDSLQNVKWVDNQESTGFVIRNNFHKQEYFPLWLKDKGSYTVKGTLLPKNAFDQSGKGVYWVQRFMDYGYCDNKPNTDTTACSVDFDWAVDPITRDTAKIDFVDFVRIYNGEQQMCGWLGETSTEVMGAEDLHLKASLSAITEAQDSIAGIITFENIQGITLNTDSVFGGNTEGRFINNGFTFNNSYIPSWNYWSGIGLSARKDVTFVDYKLGQYNSCTGSGYNKSNTFAVVYPQGETIDVNDAAGKTIRGFYAQANTYLRNAILVGDGMTTGAFAKGDWYLLKIIGTHTDATSDTIQYYLADYRSDNESEHSYINDWTWIDLSKLGNVSSITFRLSSSRNNSYGMTTPGYFLMDNFNGIYDGTSPKLSEAVITGIQEIKDENSQDCKNIIGYYTINGIKLTQPQQGINIVKYSDGRTQKIILK